MKKIDGDWNLLLVVERKTINDFQLSFTDGRLEEQKSYLLNLRKENNVNFIYIIEGDIDKDISDRSPIKSDLLKPYIKQMEMMSIPEKRTANQYDSCLELIEYLCEIQRETPLKGTPIRALAGKSKRPPEKWWPTAIALVSGVSMEVAEDIAEAFPTQSKLISRGPMRIRNMRRRKTNRRLGESIEVSVLDSIGYTMMKKESSDSFFDQE